MEIYSAADFGNIQAGFNTYYAAGDIGVFLAVIGGWKTAKWHHTTYKEPYDMGLIWKGRMDARNLRQEQLRDRYPCLMHY